VRNGSLATSGRAGTLAARTEDRRNAFDVLRLVAALLVLLSHCYPLTGHDEPVGELTGATMGEIGVIMFFAMSGFLIAKSWTDQPQAFPFAIKRTLRLVPGLIVAVVLTAFVLAPAVTTLSPGSYFTSLEPYVYALRNAVLVTFSGALPGVFTDNVYPNAVNGSLWTLPVEASAYVGAAVLGLIGGLRRPALLAGLLVFALLLVTPIVDINERIDHSGGIASVDLNIVVAVYAAFCAGSLIWAARERFVLRWPILLGLVALWVATWSSAWRLPTLVLMIAYLVIFAAFRLPDGARALTRRVGDLSYGIYIYAFPVQQLVAHLWGPGLTPIGMFALATPPVVLLAFFSWRLVEAPALALKRRVAPYERYVAGDVPQPGIEPARVGAPAPEPVVR
jgi:peptidoglycan/LPS O-acetylase OafA/YrhL